VSGKSFERARRAAHSVTLALLLAAPVSGPAWAGFGVPKYLSPVGQQAENPQVAVDAGGDAVVVWEDRTGGVRRVKARTRSAAGALGPILTLSDPSNGAENPKVALDAEGDALIVWSWYDGSKSRVHARALSAAGALGPLKTISLTTQTSGSARVAFDGDGTALIAWIAYDGTYPRILARTRSAAGVLGPVRYLSAAGESARNPQVAVNPNGFAVVVWERFAGAKWQVQARTRVAGAFRPIVTLSAAGQDASNVQVALGAAGDAVVLWRHYVGGRVQTRTRSRSTGVYGPIQTLADNSVGYDPQVALDADGDAVFVWTGADGSNYGIKARRRSAAGALGPVLTFSPAGQHAATPQVAIDGGGNVVIVWANNIPGNPTQHILARTRSAAGALGPVQTLSATTGQNAAYPEVALSPGGLAVVVWRRLDRFTGANSRIQAVAGRP
jgi:hypothetical protein